MTVAKLRGARQGKRKETGKCEGRKTLSGRSAWSPWAKKLHRYPANGQRRSLRQIISRTGGEGLLGVLWQALRRGCHRQDARLNPRARARSAPENSASDAGEVRRLLWFPECT
jgi:hypothetical protein